MSQRSGRPGQPQPQIQPPKPAEKSCVFGVKNPARSICPVVADSDNNKFLVGTLSPQQENEVHLLEFDEDDFEISSTSFLHPDGEIWSITSCPSRTDYFFTCYNAVTENTSDMKAALWQMEPQQNERRNIPLKQLFELQGHDGGPKSVIWEPSENCKKAASIDNSTVRIWDLTDPLNGKQSTKINVSEKKASVNLRAISWNPHSLSQISTANDCAIKGWDIRSSKQSFIIENSHSMAVRDLDYNPNKANQIATCGDDCKVKFWDLRNLNGKPIKEINRHTHWVWSVRYNRFHDQLVLSSGSDGRVHLENVISISSSLSSTPMEVDQEDKKREDGLVYAFEQHEDSVYSTCWSPGDPWIFASVSFDGRVFVNTVPKEEKYKIIM